MSTTEQPVTFENTNLNKVDPSASTLPEGDYTFQVVDAVIRDYEKDGVKKQRLSFGFAVSKDSLGGKLIGRRVYETLFPGEATEKMLKILANATGIQQSGSFPEWMDALKSQRPSIDAPLVKRLRSDTGAEETRINFFRVTPASA